MATDKRGLDYQQFQWINGHTTALNATNLNRIEGILDYLVSSDGVVGALETEVDAVSNTLNSTKNKVDQLSSTVNRIDEEQDKFISVDDEEVILNCGKAPIN